MLNAGSALGCMPWVWALLVDVFHFHPYRHHCISHLHLFGGDSDKCGKSCEHFSVFVACCSAYFQCVIVNIRICSWLCEELSWCASSFWCWELILGCVSSLV